jgi:hypothetical protein
VEVVEARHRVGAEPGAEPLVLGAVLQGQDRLDQLLAAAELGLHLGEHAVQPEQLGVGDVLQPLLLVQPVDPQVRGHELLHRLDQLGLVAELLFHDRKGRLLHGFLEGRSDPPWLVARGDPDRSKKRRRTSTPLAAKSKPLEVTALR